MTDELNQLNAATFNGCLHQTFSILLTEDEAIDIELVEVRGLTGHTRREDRTPFSLLFRGPRDAALEQQIYTLENDTLGRLGLFLVTVGPDEQDEGMLYEAVFT